MSEKETGSKEGEREDRGREGIWEGEGEMIGIRKVEWKEVEWGGVGRRQRGSKAGREGVKQGERE